MIREKNLMECPIDDKNLCEDPLEDGIFCDGFMAARDHREKGHRHLIGHVKVYDKDFPKCVNYWGYVDVSWRYGGNTITIKMLATDSGEDFDDMRDGIFDHYKEFFKSWECEDTPGLVVHLGWEGDSLYVHFYYNMDK